MSNMPEAVFKCQGQGESGEVCTSESEIDASNVFSVVSFKVNNLLTNLDDFYCLRLYKKPVKR